MRRMVRDIKETLGDLLVEDYSIIWVSDCATWRKDVFSFLHIIFTRHCWVFCGSFIKGNVLGVTLWTSQLQHPTDIVLRNREAVWWNVLLWDRKSSCLFRSYRDLVCLPTHTDWKTMHIPQTHKTATTCAGKIPQFKMRKFQCLNFFETNGWLEWTFQYRCIGCIPDRESKILMSNFIPELLSLRVSLSAFCSSSSQRLFSTHIPNFFLRLTVLSHKLPQSSLKSQSLNSNSTESRIMHHRDNTAFVLPQERVPKATSFLLSFT